MSDLLPWMAPWSGRVLMMLFFAAGVAIAWQGWRRRRLEAPHCPRCRYNLTGVASVACPECGYTLRSHEQLFSQSRRYRLIAIGLVLALAMPIFIVQKRVQVYGWDYYLRLYPLYAVFGETELSTQQYGPFDITFRRNRRSRNIWPTINPGDIELNPDLPIYAWYIEEGGVDLNGNGRPNLVMTRHRGGNTTTIRVYEWVDGTTRFLMEATGSSAWIHDEDGNGIYEFIADLAVSPSEERWVKIPLVEGAKPIEIKPEECEVHGLSHPSKPNRERPL